MQEESKEVLLVQAKYNLKRRAHWDRRAAVLKQIPGFWGQVVRGSLRIMYYS